MLHSVVPSDASGSSSSIALPRPAQNLSAADAVDNVTVSKAGKKAKAAAISHATAKLNVSEVKLKELEKLKQELEEVPDTTMSLPLQLCVFGFAIWLGGL